MKQSTTVKIESNGCPVESSAVTLERDRSVMKSMMISVHRCFDVSSDSNSLFDSMQRVFIH